jgi:SAM-dependent methyltransferase
MSNEKTEEIRESVRSAYTEALKSSQEGTNASSCCAPSSGCCTPPVGTAAKTAGYGQDEVSQFSDASVSSFGCGNPLAFEGVQPGQVVLDLGSGAGFDLLIASEKVGADGRVIGVDMTDAMIEAAQNNAARAGVDNVEVRKGTIEELPVEDASVDWVISNCVINLSPQKERVFAEIARVLKPGGRFAISDIVAEEVPERVRNQAEVYSACIGGAISEADYAAGLRAAGLSEVEVAERFVYEAAQLRDMVGAASRDTGSAETKSRYRIRGDKPGLGHRRDHREGVEREVPRAKVGLLDVTECLELLASRCIESLIRAAAGHDAGRCRFLEPVEQSFLELHQDRGDPVGTQIGSLERILGQIETPGDPLRTEEELHPVC